MQIDNKEINPAHFSAIFCPTFLPAEPCRSKLISFRSPWKILPDTVENVDVETVEGVDQVGRAAVPQLQAEGVLISARRQPFSLNQFGVH